MNKLSIIIISENKRRAKSIIHALERIEHWNVLEKNMEELTLTTNDTIYKAYSIDMIKGIKADQVILDYVFDKKKIQPILSHSCVPKEFQIIDDRKILS